MSRWECFGERKAFAVEARLVPDPDPRTASRDEGWSYGEWRLFVRGRCLTRHAGPDGAPKDEVRWYLAPLLNWLAETWTALFHEQRPPEPRGDHENLIVAFEQGERLLLEDERPAASDQRREMQAWRNRHSLWAGAAGGVYPNVWLRRQSDLMEVSYDPGVTVGAPLGLQFQFNRGAALVDVAKVAGALDGFLGWGASQWAGRLRPRPPVGDGTAAVEWMLGPRLAAVLGARGPIARPSEHGVLYPLSPAVAMFGSLTPQTTEKDAQALLATLEAARSDAPEAAALAALVADRPPPSREGAWEEGYEVALDVLERMELPRARSGYTDVSGALNTLGVRLRHVEVHDESLRGIAIAGEGFAPTLVVNGSARWNHRPEGLRFTLAHELAHILLDRGAARRITHASTPWAPESVERRANAFAAMFLMPPQLIDAAIAAAGPLETAQDLQRIARRLRCGRSAVLEHLMNLDRVSATVFYRLRAEMSRP